MACTYTININGESVEILSDVPVGEIQSINDLERLLNKQSIESLSNLKTQIASISEIEELDLDHINENSVGVYTPADLLRNLRDNSDSKLFGKLTLGGFKNRQIVVSGFGDENVPTQFYKDHIFLNLNYMYDYDNKIIALTELALFNTDPENYTENSALLRDNINNNDPETITVINELLGTLTESKSEADINNLIKGIRLAYYKIDIKLTSDIANSNISVLRENLGTVWETNNELKENIEENYLPKGKVSVESLKQGDLVLVPSEDTSSIYTSGIYEIFYDSYVDIEGNSVIRTVFKTTSGEYETRKRLAKVYYKEGTRTKIKQSNVVDARISSSDEFSNYNYDPKTKYTELTTRFFKGKAYSGLIFYESLLDILKNPQTKVVINKESFKIKSVKGSTVTLATGKVLNVKDINKISYPTSKFQPLGGLDTAEDWENSVWSKHSKANIGEHIGFLKTKNATTLSEGVVIGFGIRNDVPIVTYLNDKGKIANINQSNIRYISNPTSEYHISTEEQINIKSIFDFIYSGKNPIESIPHSNKRMFKESDYSTSELNQYSFISNKDLLIHKGTGSIFKVISSNRGELKTSFLVGDVHKHFMIKREELNQFQLFTKNPINESFALSNVQKNRYSIYTSSSDNSIEIKVYQNRNGYIFTLPANLSESDRNNHVLYENDTKEITAKTKKDLKERFNLETIPEKLYTSTINNNILKNTEYTRWIPLTNDKFSKILESKTGLQNFLVPGSFITFKGNAHQFIVEKVTKNEVLVSYYHYTNKKNDSVKNSNLQYVKAEKFIINAESLNKIDIAGIHLPKWATVADQELSKIVVNKPTKSSKFLPINDSDSTELVMSMVNLVKERFGVDVMIITNKDLKDFKNEEYYDASAFTDGGQLYINIDKASVSEPVHEILHLVLSTMKYNNPDVYYSLVNSVQYHPMFKEVLENYSDVNTELLEETFVRLLSKTFRQNILKDKIFTEESFNTAMTGAIQDMMNLSKDTNLEDPFELLGKTTGEVLYEFGSALIENEESLIDLDKASYMFGVSAKVKSLLDEGILKQKCNY